MRVSRTQICKSFLLAFNVKNVRIPQLGLQNKRNFQCDFLVDIISNLNRLQMQNFPKTISVLNSMIDKLEANTGGDSEPKVQTQEKPTSTQPEQETKPQKNSEKPQKKEQSEEDKAKREAKKEKKAAEKEKKAPKEAAKKQPEGSKEVDPKFFAQIDMRIGGIVECWKHPQSENLYCEKINIGGEVREIASGLQKFVPIQKMTGNAIVMANLKPRPLAGFASNGMVVCASTPEHDKVELLIPEGQVGERVFLEGHQELFSEGQILPVLNPKRKVVEKCLEHFKTDDEGFVVWQGIRLRTKAGPIKSLTIPQGNVG